MIAIVGKPAPFFEMETYLPELREIEKIRLDDFSGKWLVLYFYPADFTFVCPTELKDIAERYSAIQHLGGEVLAVSTDTVYSHKAWLETEMLVKNVKYPLASDHSGSVGRAYGVYDEASGISQRAAFIIDPDGVLKVSYIVDEFIGRSSGELVRLLKALKHVRETPGIACPASWDEGYPVLKPSIKIAGHVSETLKKKVASKRR